MTTVPLRPAPPLRPPVILSPWLRRAEGAVQTVSSVLRSNHRQAGLSLPFSLLRIPRTAPSRLHSLLETRRVHFRKPFQRSRPSTPAYEVSKLLHVGESPANSGEPTVETGTLDLRFCRPLETALVVVA